MDQLALVNDTGAPGDQVTADSRIAGTIIGFDAGADTIVHFDHNGDGRDDGLAKADANGGFNYAPRLLPPGAITLRARAESAGTMGQWVSLSFTLEEPENLAPILASLTLANDTGPSSTDRITSDVTLVAQVANDGDIADLMVEFDQDGDGAAEGFAATDENGQISYLPADLRFGESTITARALEWDRDRATYLYSDWVSLTLNYQPACSGLGLRP